MVVASRVSVGSGSTYDLDHRLELVFGAVGRVRFWHVGFRLRAVQPRFLLRDFLLQGAHGIEILLELVLVLLA